MLKVCSSAQQLSLRRLKRGTIIILYKFYDNMDDIFTLGVTLQARMDLWTCTQPGMIIAEIIVIFIGFIMTVSLFDITRVSKYYHNLRLAS